MFAKNVALRSVDNWVLKFSQTLSKSFNCMVSDLFLINKNVLLIVWSSPVLMLTLRRQDELKFEPSPRKHYRQYQHLRNKLHPPALLCHQLQVHTLVQYWWHSNAKIRIRVNYGLWISKIWFVTVKFMCRLTQYFNSRLLAKRTH